MSENEPTGTVDSGSSGSTGSSSGSSSPSTAMGALERAASSAATQDSSAASGTTGTSQTAGQAAPNAGATGQSGKPALAAGSQAAGSIDGTPEHRIEAAVRNARAAERKELMSQLGWAQGMDRSRIERAIRILDMLDNDSKGFHARLGQELGSQGPDPNAMPEPDLVSADGKVKAFSADAIAKYGKVLSAQIRQELMQEMKPVLTAHQQAEDNARREEFVQEGRKSISTALSHLSTFPHWKENEKAISEEMQTIPRETVEKYGIVTSMYMAYSQWLSKALPTMIQDAIKQDREGLKRSAATATGSVMPSGSPASGAKKQPSNTQELAEAMAQKYAAAGA